MLFLLSYRAAAVLSNPMNSLIHISWETKAVWLFQLGSFRCITLSCYMRLIKTWSSVNEVNSFSKTLLSRCCGLKYTALLRCLLDEKALLLFEILKLTFQAVPIQLTRTLHHDLRSGRIVPQFWPELLFFCRL